VHEPKMIIVRCY